MNSPLKRTVPGDTAGRIDDVMVKDPWCNVYFPQRDGIPMEIEGETIYFCSTDCRDRYMASLSKT